MAWIRPVLSLMSFAKVAPELRLPFIHLFNPRSSRGFQKPVLRGSGIWKSVEEGGHARLGETALFHRGGDLFGDDALNGCGGDLPAKARKFMKKSGC
jgi:hypothetical protein